MSTKEVLQTGKYSSCELNVLVDMCFEGKEIAYIAEVLCRSVEDVEKQIKFKGLYKVRANAESDLRLKSIIRNHCGAAA